MTDLTPLNSPLELAIAKLRQLTQVNVQPYWKSCAADNSPATATQSDLSTWQTIEPNEKDYITWAAGRQVLWLRQEFVIPQDLQGYPVGGLRLRLALTWWAEKAEIFVNGSLVQEGDLFDSSTRVLLNRSVTPGEVIQVALRLVSPGHDNGALTIARCIYEYNNDENIEPGFVADELAVLQKYLETFAPEQLNILEAGVAEINWAALPADIPNFERSLSILRQNLRDKILDKGIINRKIWLLGHAHLDMAWLWPVNETWEVAQRTFESALKLGGEFPELVFCHSTPALYAWIEQHRPDLFTAIQQRVADNRWEVVGGMWIEPELNLINGESLVRQILYAQLYVQEKFGALSTVAWLPDTFGFCWQLPQVLKQGGIEFFVTQKLLWNDTTQFPYGVFWWQAPDGTRIFSLMSAPIGEGIQPVKLAAYACEWERQTNLKDALWLLGVGDHGGGPTRDMLEVARRWQDSPFFPKLEFTTAVGYLQQQRGEMNHREAEVAEKRGGEVGGFPVWNDELYLEFHRGCYTTHAEQKRWNRRCEDLLYRAELFSSLASIGTGMPYPKTELESAWKMVLFNQFHDILPGSSIPEVFVDANRDWQDVERVGLEILEAAEIAIARHILLPQPPQPDALPVVVFNPLTWQRSEVVAVSLPASGGWRVCDDAGQEVLSQVESAVESAVETASTQTKSACADFSLLFLANNVPGVGYRCFWLCPSAAETLDNSLSVAENAEICTEYGYSNTRITQKSFSEREKYYFGKDWVLENEFLRVVVEGETGDLSSIVDKVNSREILDKAAANQLQAFQDSGQYWDAWNINPNYAQHPLPATELKAIEWVEREQVRQRLRVVRQLGKSEFCQDYVLETQSQILKIVTSVDWQERHVLVKAAFPLNLEADFATYEIPCGAIKRTTRPEEPRDKAKWEVPALRWADLTFTPNFSSGEGEESQNPVGVYGVSLLNDCKYGYDAQPNQLRLTLLRSPSWPDPEADKGCHEFIYALYPHSGSWQEAYTVRRGYELNLPLRAMLLPEVGENIDSPLPPVGKLLDLSAENLILMALKQSEDNPQQWIMRCYECHGEEAQLQLQSDLGLEILHPVDLLERKLETPQPICPWKIVSFRMAIDDR